MRKVPIYDGRSQVMPIREYQDEVVHEIRNTKSGDRFGWSVVELPLGGAEDGT